MTQYQRVASVLQESNPRYRHQNIVQLELDLPERTTQDFDDLIGQ